MTKSRQEHRSTFIQHIARVARFLAFLLLLTLFCLPSHAQETKFHTDGNKTYKRAIEQFNQRNYVTAKRLFEKVVSSVPPSTQQEWYILRANAEYYIAVCALKMEQPEAKELFETYIRDYHEMPNTRKAYFQLGKYYYKEREYADAIQWLQKVDIYDLSNAQIAEYKFVLGYCYFYQQNLGQAKNLFRQVKDIENKYYYPANYYYGFILFQRGDYDKALASFQTIKESYRYKRIVPYYISQIYFMKGKYNKVLSYAPDQLENNRLQYKKELNQLIGQAYFQKQQYRKALPYLQEYADRTKKVRKEDLYQLAYAQYKTGNIQDATGNFKELNYLKDTMGHNSLYLLGSCYLKTDQREKARRAFGQASQLDYDPFIRQKAIFNYGKLSYELGYDQTAVNQLQKYVENYPDAEENKEAKEMLTEAFLGSNNYRQALKIIESMQEKTPKIKQAYQKVSYSLGVELYKNHKNLKALALFNTSLDHPIQDKFQALAYFWRGEIYYQQDQLAKAISSHRQFLELAKISREPVVQSQVKRSNYTLGYCYFQQEDYQKALVYFNNSLNASERQSANRKTKRLNADATLRKADCHFILKDYGKAVVAYNNIIINKSPNAEYALFQKALLQGLQGNPQKKVQTLSKIVNQYSESLYADDALLEMATTYQNMNEPESALNHLGKLIDNYPNSILVKKAHLKLGLIHYNMDHNQKALNNYKIVAKRYSNSEEAKDALLAIKDISINTNKPEIYIDLLENTPGAKVSTSSQDSVIYMAAERKYLRGDCENAIPAFDKYLNKFPQGAFALPAHFYRGECLYNNNDYTPALNDYQYIVQKSLNRFTEKALAKASGMNYHKFNNYKKAFEQYKRLYEVASFKENKFKALMGKMRSAFRLGKHEEVSNFSQQVMDSQNASEEDRTEARYYKAKAHMALGELDKAHAAFTKTAEATNSEKGVEAEYNIAKIHFKRDELKQAKSTAMAIKNHTPYYEDWTVRAFILLADIFLEQGNLFQAKATIQSILDNYEGDNQELIKEAGKKLQTIEEKEKKASKVIDEAKGDTSTMQMDTTQEIEPGE